MTFKLHQSMKTEVMKEMACLNTHTHTHTHTLGREPATGSSSLLVLAPPPHTSQPTVLIHARPRRTDSRRGPETRTWRGAILCSCFSLFTPDDNNKSIYCYEDDKLDQTVHLERRARRRGFIPRNRTGTETSSPRRRLHSIVLFLSVEHTVLGIHTHTHTHRVTHSYTHTQLQLNTQL